MTSTKRKTGRRPRLKTPTEGSQTFCYINQSSEKFTKYTLSVDLVSAV